MEMWSVLGFWRRYAGAGAGCGVGGFTLLELIVVLALVGLVTVLAVPNLERLYEGFARKAEQGRILNRIAGLGREAMLRGRAFAVYGTEEESDEAWAGRRTPGYESYDLEVPSGWVVSLDRPLLVRANGVCLGATVTLVHDGDSAVRVDLQAPFCRVPADA